MALAPSDPLRQVPRGSAGRMAFALARQRQIDHLVAFTRLAGYVQYFHPSYAAYCDAWETFLRTGPAVLESVSSVAELQTALEALFRRVAPTVQIYPTINRPVAPALHVPPAQGERVRWHYFEVDHGRSNGTVYRRVRQRQASQADDGDSAVYRAELGLGLSCAVPLAIAPAAAEPPHPWALEAKGRGALDTQGLVAAIAVLWNVLAHFYPYWDVAPCGWELALRQAFAALAKRV
jgi:hypothetical protein